MHRDLNVQTGDTIYVDGAEGIVVAVNLKWTEDGIYGKRAIYKADTDGGTEWVPDYKVTKVLYA